MTDQTCDGCQWWKRETYNGENEDVRAMVTKRGQCRRHAAQAMIGTDHDSQGQAIHCGAFEWPITQEDDWCGDWDKKEEESDG